MMEKNEAKIHLVTTSHVSEKSVKEVRDTIEEIKPDIVGVELDLNRYKALMSEKNKKSSFRFFKRNLFFGFFQKLLSYLQSRVGENLGVDPGSEMKEAINVAEKNDIPIVLLDRDIRITLERMWKKMGFLEKLKVFGALFLGLFGVGTKKVEVDKITKDETVNYLMDELRNFSPSVAETIIDERDAYIANNLLGHAAKGREIVAVIGAGHKKGVLDFLQNHDKIPDIKELEEV